MDLTLLLIKFIVAVSVVLGLSFISERISPKFAGFISGLPTGTAITLFFFGIENGPSFAATSAIYNLAGFVAMQILLLAYWKVSMRNKKNIPLAALMSVVSFIVVITFIRHFNLTPIESALLMVASIPIFIYMFIDIPDVKIEKKVQLKLKVMLFRAFLAATIILCITTAAQFLGPELAGLLSAFPTTLFPLLLITHSTYTAEHVHSIIKNVPQGLLSITIYSLAVNYTYPTFGVALGTLLAYLPVAIFIILFQKYDAATKISAFIKGNSQQ